jgi:hypothetical protein
VTPSSCFNTPDTPSLCRHSLSAPRHRSLPPLARINRDAATSPTSGENRHRTPLSLFLQNIPRLTSFLIRSCRGRLKSPLATVEACRRRNAAVPPSIRHLTDTELPRWAPLVPSLPGAWAEFHSCSCHQKPYTIATLPPSTAVPLHMPRAQWLR